MGEQQPTAIDPRPGFEPMVHLDEVEKRFGPGVRALAERSIQLGITIGERCAMQGVEIASMLIDQGAFIHARDRQQPTPTTDEHSPS